MNLSIALLLFLGYSFFIAWIISVVDNKLKLRDKLFVMCGTYRTYKIVIFIILLLLLIILDNWLIPIIVYHRLRQYAQIEYQ